MFSRTATAIAYADLYTRLAAHRVVDTTKETIEKAKDHKSEIACIGGTAVVVGLAARVNGFQAGYAYAQQS